PLGEGEGQHRVRLSPYWIGKYPVTNEQYGRFLKATGHRDPTSWDDSRFNDPRQPVVGVNWLDAKAYCDWAGLELPTESQWEAAARGADGHPYPWGEKDATAEYADHGKRYTKDRPDPVGSHPRGAGPYGAQDQAGGVWEWCRDEFDTDAYRDRDGKRDPEVKPKDESSKDADRVLRGGSWADPSGDLHAAIRFRDRAGSRPQFIGFR
ncbi:MAG: formylglycine-generating enzyme family protein, partial [bacterium]|nr:formylglycine-generating enzyme family protein [bacterium]